MIKEAFLKARDVALSVLHWVSDEAHRRFVVGAIVGIASYGLKSEIDSNFVDCLIMIADAALLAIWSSRTPKIPNPENL